MRPRYENLLFQYKREGYKYKTYTIQGKKIKGIVIQEYLYTLTKRYPLSELTNEDITNRI